MTEFQLHLLAELGSGDTLRGVLRRQGSSNAYSRCAWHVDRAKKVLGARTVAHAVAVAIRRGWLSEPTGSDMRVIPMFDRLPPSGMRIVPETIDVPVRLDAPTTIRRFFVEGEPMPGRWGVIPKGWDRAVRHLTVRTNGDVALPLVLAPGDYTFRQMSTASR